MPPKRYFEQAQADAEVEVDSATAGAASRHHDAGPPTAADDANSGRNATLFVSRLPYTATSVDLQTLFSDVGPLKRAFVVTDPITKASKGVGYVTFAIAEDAKSALQQLQGKTLDGRRKIHITFADEKAPMKERKAARSLLAAQAADPSVGSVAKKPRFDRPASSSGPRPRLDFEKDADAVRTLVLSGLAACNPKADSKQIYKRARKIGDVENVVYPNVASSNPDDVALVIFRTPNHAMTAVEKLHAHTFKGVQLSAILKKRADNATKLARHMRPETLAKREKIRKDIERISGKGTMPVLSSEVDKSSRLIIRNLPFDVTEADLRAVFLPHGPIFQIQIPTAPSKSKPVQPEEVEDAEVTSEAEDDDDAVQDASDAESDKDDTMADKASSHDAEDPEDDHSVESDQQDRDVDAEGQGAEGTQGTKDGEVEDEDDGEDADGTDDGEMVEHAAAHATSTPPVSSGERGRGFAFVWHVSRNDAAKALEAVNGRAIRHGAAEHAVYKAAKGKKGRDTAKKLLDAVRATAQPERVVAVDWALSKKDWEAKADQNDVETDAEAEDDDGEGEEGEEENEEDEDEEADEDGDGDEDEDEGIKNEGSDQEARPALPQPEEGTTLFIRNLPYQATEEELKNVFRNFGPLRYAKITMDKATKRSKGTGFVCFWQASSADAALQQARIIEKEAGTNGSSSSAAKDAKNPFSLPSVLTADPSAPLAASLNLHGRVLNVIPAVARTEASKLETSGRKQREKEDKRNTWLLREGVPFPESQIARHLSAAECDKRLQSFSIRRSQLGSNPALFISKTRLAVRQLPLFVSDKMLKKLALHAIRHFKDEVKEGVRPDLDEYERADRTISTALAADGGFAGKKKGERPTAVVQAKVVRQADRIDPLTGQGRSRGYGFLELRTFQEALKVIRWANANKAISSLFVEWWQQDLEQRIDNMKRQIKAKSASTTTTTATTGTKSAAETADEVEEMGERIKRMERKVDEFKAGQKPDKSERGGLLVLEFSIENATVTRKRQEKLTAIREGAAKREQGDAAFATASSGNEEPSTRSKPASRPRDGRRPSSSTSSMPGRPGKAQKHERKQRADDKTRRKAADKVQSDEKQKETKFGAMYGSSIGRKRRAKKLAKK